MALLAVLVNLCLSLLPVMANAPTDIRMDEKARNIHRIDSINILVYTVLLILTVCLIWAFKRRRARFLHETGLAVIFGEFLTSRNRSFLDSVVVVFREAALRTEHRYGSVRLRAVLRSRSPCAIRTSASGLAVFRDCLTSLRAAWIGLSCRQEFKGKVLMCPVHATGSRQGTRAWNFSASRS